MDGYDDPSINLFIHSFYPFLPSMHVCIGGVSLRPGDGIIHSWLNRMLLPDTLGTGGDSHTRFPIGMMMIYDGDEYDDDDDNYEGMEYHDD